MIFMYDDTVWEVFHDKDLDRAVDKAHEKLPYSYQVINSTVQYLNNEYVITVTAGKKGTIEVMNQVQEI